MWYKTEGFGDFLVNLLYSLGIEKRLFGLERELRVHLREWAIRLDEIENYPALGKCIWQR